MSDSRRELERSPAADSRPRSRLLFAFVWLLASGLARLAVAAPIVFDTFVDPDPSPFIVLGAGLNPAYANAFLSAGIIGGQRDVLLQVVGQAQPNSSVGLVGVDPSDLEALQIGTNGDSPTVTTLQYSGLHNLNTATSIGNAHALGGTGIDLTDGGANDHFYISFLSSDAQPTSGLDVAITVTSGGGAQSSTVTKIAPNQQTSFVLELPFADLVGNAVWTDVDSIKVVFNGVAATPNVDFRIAQLGTVPEPSTTALLAGAMLALGVFRLCRGPFKRHDRGHRSALT